MFNLTKIDVSEDTVECIWRSSHFRAAIRRKFEEVIVADNSNADSRAIEEQLFAKVKTKDEYLDLSARVIIHFKQLKGQTTVENQDEQKDDIPQEKYKLKRKSTDQSEPPNPPPKQCKLSD